MLQLYCRCRCLDRYILLLSQYRLFGWLFVLLSFFFSSRRRHTRYIGDWSSDVCSSDLARIRVALVSYLSGRLADAQREFERLAAPARLGRSDSLAVAAVTGDGWDQLDYLGYLGATAARQGNREPALRVDRTLAGSKRPYLFGRHTVWRARIRALLGEREVAVGLLREAIAGGYPHVHALHIDLAFESLRDYPPFQELMKPKQ